MGKEWPQAFDSLTPVNRSAEMFGDGSISLTNRKIPHKDNKNASDIRYCGPSCFLGYFPSMKLEDQRLHLLLSFVAVGP